MSAAEVREQTQKNHKQGFQPADVAGYLDGGQERYAAVWLRGEGADDVRSYAGVAGKEHHSLFGPLREAGLSARVFHTFLGRDGSERCSAVWGKGKPASMYAWDLDEASYINGALDHGLPVDVSLRAGDKVRSAREELLAWLATPPWVALAVRSQNPEVPHPERRYAGTFAAEARFEAEQVQGLTPTEHLARCRELAGRGYRPAALAVASLPAHGGPIAASIWHRPVVADADKERLAKRQANAAVALLRLGQEADVWPLLRHKPDPRLRSYLIHRLSPMGADPQAIVARLDATDVEVSEKRALVLCLGEFGKEQLPQAQRRALVPRLLELYRHDPDPGLHGAAAWLLRTWARRDGLAGIDGPLKKLDEELKAMDREVASRGRQPPESRRWYVNGQGQTMVVIDAHESFLMGSPRTEAERYHGPEGNEERQHRRRIGRTFALAATEVTVAQFLHFRKDHSYQKAYSPTDEHPINTVNWYDAAAYCNWLSEQERIPQDQWCYKRHPQKGYADGMRPRPDYLHRRGYRLPTEAEWEYACRAGAVTARPYGETEDLLEQYAWYTKNSGAQSMLPPGWPKPNDLGLFDMLGNALEWCQDAVVWYPQQRRSQDIGDKEDMRYIVDSQYRVLRGGGFTNPARLVRCAYRNSDGTGVLNDLVGFRPARTYP
jgi:formylglycine-generating enzyme required for sulfatase activity